MLLLIITERNDPSLIDESWFNKRMLETECSVPCVGVAGCTKKQLKCYPNMCLSVIKYI